MVSNVAAGTGATRRAGTDTGAQGQIDMLLTQIKNLRKKISTLQKQLMDATDPGARIKLIKEIQDLERDVQLLQEQISQIQAAEQRKAAMRQQAQHEMAAEEKAGSQKKKVRQA